MKKFSQSARGFTLIELLVVIAIIGILSAVVLTSLNSARLKARDARRISDIKQVQLALELSYDATGTYPESLATLSPAYMAAIPKDPTDQTEFGYAPLSSGSSYILGVSLEADNGVLDTDTDTVDQAFTFRDVVTNCNANDEAAPFVFCVAP